MMPGSNAWPQSLIDGMRNLHAERFEQDISRMTPEKLSKSNSEHGHQRALFAWAKIAEMCGFAAAWDDKSYEVQGYALETYGKANGVVALEWLHAIPNGGGIGDGDKKTAMIRGAQRKAEGVKAGVLDLQLPHPAYAERLAQNDWPPCAPVNGVFCGLFIEMKKPGKLKNTSPEQKRFIETMNPRGYICVTADHWRTAAQHIERYLGAAV